jgi:hypothetical protein
MKMEVIYAWNDDCVHAISIGGNNICMKDVHLLLRVDQKLGS